MDESRVNMKLTELVYMGRKRREGREDREECKGTKKGEGNKMAGLYTWKSSSAP